MTSTASFTLSPFTRSAVRFASLALLLLALTVMTPLRAAEETAVGTLKGQLLVATDELQGSSFARSVIFMIEHDSSGALGLVVNRPAGEIPVADIFKKLDLPSEEVTGSIRVHAGGPVAPGTVFILHSDDFDMAGSKPVAPHLALSDNPEILRAIGAGDGPAGYIFAFGYAGWGPGQLEAELKRGIWVTVPASVPLIFDESNRSKWEQALEAYRIDL